MILQFFIRWLNCNSSIPEYRGISVAIWDIPILSNCRISICFFYFSIVGIHLRGCCNIHLNDTKFSLFDHFLVPLFFVFDIALLFQFQFFLHVLQTKCTSPFEKTRVYQICNLLINFCDIKFVLAICIYIYMWCNVSARYKYLLYNIPVFGRHLIPSFRRKNGSSQLSNLQELAYK